MMGLTLTTQHRKEEGDATLAGSASTSPIHPLTRQRRTRRGARSGTFLDRPGLGALRDFVAAGGVETVLALCPDRLSRNYHHPGGP